MRIIFANNCFVFVKIEIIKERGAKILLNEPRRVFLFIKKLPGYYNMQGAL